MLVAPPAAAAKAATVVWHVHLRVAAGHHAGSTLGMECGRHAPRRHAARLQHAVPEPACRAQLRDAEEDVGVGREGEVDELGGGGRSDAGLVEGAQIGDPGGDGGGDLLRLAGPSGVVGATVGEEDRGARCLGSGTLCQLDGSSECRRRIERCADDGDSERIGTECHGSGLLPGQKIQQPGTDFGEAGAEARWRRGQPRDRCHRAGPRDRPQIARARRSARQHRRRGRRRS